jgi:hypothetical protein
VTAIHSEGNEAITLISYVIAINGLSGEEATANFTGRRYIAALYSMRLPRYARNDIVVLVSFFILK